MRILLALVALGFAWPAAAREALVLNSLDHTLSTVDLDSGTPQLGEAAFAGFPNHVVVQGDVAYAVVSGADHVLLLDAGTRTALDTLETGAGTNPYAVAVDAFGSVYVSLFNTNEVVRFNASGVETGRAPAGRSPEGVLLAGGQLFVAATGFRLSDFGYDPGAVTVLDPLTLASLGSVPVGTNPQWIEAAGSEIHVLCTGNYFSSFGAVHVFDPLTLAPLDTVILGGSPGAFEAGGGRGYASDYFGGIFVYDLATHAVLHDAGSPLVFGASGYSGLALDGIGGLLVALFGDDALARVRLSDETVDAVYATGDGPVALAVYQPAPVPVRLLAFDVRVSGGGAVVTFTAAASEGTSFRVERRSAFEEQWAVAAEIVTLRATEAGTQTGEFRDAMAARFYRLSAVQRDGSVEVLGEREVPAALAGVTALGLRPLTNPARSSLDMEIQGFTGAVRLALIGVDGRVVKESWLGAGARRATVPVSDLPAGVYFVKAVSVDQVAVARVAVVP